jgi:hypothetical protein
LQILVVHSPVYSSSDSERKDRYIKKEVHHADDASTYTDSAGTAVGTNKENMVVPPRRVRFLLRLTDILRRLDEQQRWYHCRQWQYEHQNLYHCHYHSVSATLR